MQSKTLVLDIETSPVLAYVWALKDQNIGLNQIHKDWDLMAWGAKWLDDPVSKVMYDDRRDDKDDKRILKGVWKLLDEADIVITQNGKKFDSRKLNARFMLHGMPPPSPYKHLDTYLIARDAAEFTSHKLEYLTANLNEKYKKLDHGRYPGMTLWTECLKGNQAAWEAMKEYNVHDVLSTEELFKIIRPWTNKSAAPVFRTDGKCVMCGDTHLQKRGFDHTLTASYQRLQCQKCKKWQRGEKIKKEAHGRE